MNMKVERSRRRQTHELAASAADLRRRADDRTDSIEYIRYSTIGLIFLGPGNFGGPVRAYRLHTHGHGPDFRMVVPRVDA
jgi:hypothetical protein